MALTTKLELRQGQQLVMTPQLQQAIRLLQFSNLELSAFVDTELERNPLLEREAESPSSEPQELAGSEPPAAEGASPAADQADWPELKAGGADAVDAFDAEPELIYPDTAPTELAGSDAASWASLRTKGGSFEDDDGNFDHLATAEVSLRNHLEQQLCLALSDPIERLIGQHLIDTVDEAGYLQADIAQMADRLGCADSLVARVVAVLQTFDPAGVCARSLAECLALQLKDQNRYDPLIARLLDNLPLLAARDLAGLRRAVGCDMDEIGEMVAEIKRLNPKPGLAFGSVQLQPVVPDVLVRAASDGSWIIELNADTLPRVLVNRSYLARVSPHARPGKDKDYLMECLQTANWLVKSLDQRARTILRVAEEIVRQQDAFLTHGVQHLRPLNLKTVADAISMHESTVSRVTSNKYIATPRGIFELKYFFTSSISAAGDGEAYSSEAVRYRIKQLIDAETPASVLSDDKIVDMLRADGIDIARRTVAKYREGMRIASSVQRRRDKRMLEQVGRSA